MKDYLLSDDLRSRRKILILSGLGGMGKTQLAIMFAKLHQEAYSATFWLNATNEETLKRSLASMAARVLESDMQREMSGVQEVGQLIDHVRQWLSRPGNNRWLLIFDNHDDPQMPGEEKPHTYEIRRYFPHVAHGSIIITTRSSRLIFGKTLQLQKLVDLRQSLAILAQRSRRSDVEHGETPRPAWETVG